jgi:DNA-directed RNA polymerase specialized sigma24 family protein
LNTATIEIGGKLGVVTARRCDDRAGTAWECARREALRFLAARFRSIPAADREDAVSAATAQLLSGSPPDHVDLVRGLLTASGSRLRDALRHERVVRKHAGIVTRSPPPQDGSIDRRAADPIDEVERLERLRRARRIVETDPRIPEASRPTLLALLDGRTYADVAGERGLSPECVRKRAERGAAALIGILDLREGRE